MSQTMTYSPLSLGEQSAWNIQHIISAMNKNIELNYLSNPNLPVHLQNICKY